MLYTCFLGIHMLRVSLISIREFLCLLWVSLMGIPYLKSFSANQPYPVVLRLAFQHYFNLKMVRMSGPHFALDTTKLQM